MAVQQVSAERPFRLPDLDPATLTTEQREVLDDIRRSLGREPGGPVRAWIRNPLLLRGILLIIKAETESPSLGKRLNRLAAITVARQWGAQYEWFAHAPLAAGEGVEPEVIEALRLGRRPDFVRDDENMVYDLIQELDRDKGLSDETFSRARAMLGDDGVAELIANVGAFTMFGMAIKALDLRPPEPFDACPLP